MKYKIRNGILWKEVDGEVVVVDEKNNDYSYLNASGTEIWKLIDKGFSFEEILEKLLEEYDVAEKIIKTDIEKLIEELIKNKYIEKAK